MAEKKKKKSRIKKFLKAAAKAALIGGAAYGATKLFGGKKKFGTDAGFLKSGAAGGASLSTPPIHGTDHIQSVTHPAAVSTAGQDDSRFNTRFSKPLQETIPKGVRARNLAANAAANEVRKQTFDAKPRFGSLSNARVNQPGSAIIRQYKKGGSVKKAKATGIAKRGFGRALMKGKK